MSSSCSTGQNLDIYPLKIDKLPEFAIKKLKEELNENSQTKPEALEELRCFLQKNENTREIEFHEDFLIQFLRRNKYRIEDSFQHLQNFVNLHKKETSLFKSIPDHYFETVSTKYIVLLPKRCPEGCAIVMFPFAKWNPKEMPFDCFKNLILILFMQLLRDPMNQINGFKVIYDFEDTLSLLKYCTPQNVYLVYNAAVNCAPCRWKAIHAINEGIALKVAWNIAKHFLSKKIKSRVIFHSQVEGLFDYFPRSIIPAKYGGTLQEPELTDWVRKANKENESYSIEGQPNTCYY